MKHSTFLSVENLRGAFLQSPFWIKRFFFRIMLRIGFKEKLWVGFGGGAFPKNTNSKDMLSTDSCLLIFSI